MTQSKNMSLTSLADRVGVSPATISRVLNNREGIGASTRKRVLDAAREYGYRPRVAVRQTTVALVMDKAGESKITGGGFVESLTLGIVEALARHRVVVETFTAGNLDTLPDRFVDGVLAVAWKEETLSLLQSLDKVPVVILNRPDEPLLNNIQIDNEQIGRMAAECFIAHGHRRVGLIANRWDLETESRVAGYRKALFAAGSELPEQAIHLSHTVSPIHAVHRLRAEGYTGVFVSCEHLSMEIPFLCCEVMGIEIPRELSIIGFGVATAMKFHRPPMTLVAPPVEKLADTAVNVLTSLIGEDMVPPSQTVLEAELILRSSVAPLHSR